MRIILLTILTSWLLLDFGPNSKAQSTNKQPVSDSIRFKGELINRSSWGGWENLLVEITDSTGGVLFTTTTDTNGFFEFHTTSQIVREGGKMRIWSGKWHYFQHYKLSWFTDPGHIRVFLDAALFVGPSGELNPLDYCEYCFCQPQWKNGTTVVPDIWENPTVPSPVIFANPPQLRNPPGGMLAP